MKDINTILKQKVYDALKALITTAPIYYKYAPSNVVENIYILISTISNVDASNMHTSFTDTTIVVGIYSRDSLANPGQAVNDAAMAVYAALYPDRHFNISLEPEAQVCSTSLVNDVTPDAINTGNQIFINRFISFRLNIYHK